MSRQNGMTTTRENTLQPMFEMNMTPLIDVLLVLIIMLIITIPRQNHWLPMVLASGASGVDKPEIVTLDIDFDGSVTWNGEAVPDRDTLNSKFAAIAEGPKRTQVQLSANKLVPYKSVASILASAKRKGVDNIGLVGNERFM